MSAPNLPSRRTVLKVAAGVCGAFPCIAEYGGRQPAPEFNAPPASRRPFPIYKAVFDERFNAPRAFAAGAPERGIPAAAIRGDVTSLFFNDLDLRWKQGPVRLAGYTMPSSLFCLDLLARDRGMRLSYCAVNPHVENAWRVLDGGPPEQKSNHLPLPNSVDPVFWIISPTKSQSA
jgi:hypothetical protein